MDDFGFWIGTVVGFVGALLGGLVASWAQYKYKIKEIRYLAEQEGLKRAEEERAREEAECEKLRNQIMNLSYDMDGEDRWEFMSRYANHLRSGRRFGSSALAWYAGRETERNAILKAMDVTELRVLYTGLLTIPIVSTISEAKEREKARELKEREQELNSKLGELLEKLKPAS
jgi:hypothetical protein